MKKIVYILVVLSSILVSCRWQEVEPRGQSPISIDPQVEQVNSSTKAAETLFLDGDKIGLYVVRSGRALEAAHNATDNALFTVSSGQIGGTPAIYYPSRDGLVDLYSYYPYQPGLANALEVFFGIHTDQADFSSYRASDFCYGAKSDVAPTPSAAPVTYTHKMSRVVFEITTPPSISGRDVASVESVVLLDVIDKVKVNLASGVVSNEANRSDVTMYRQAQDLFSAIIPPQSLQGGALARIGLKFTDGLTENYLLNIASGHSVVGGSSNTFDVTIVDNGMIVLNGDPTVGAWQTVTASDIIAQPVDNNFNVLWLLPNPKYNTATSVELSIYNAKSNLTHDFVTTNFELLVDRSSSKLAMFKFDLVLPLLSGVSYPYDIQAVSFFNSAGDLIQRCDALVAANVTRGGAYTLGIEQSNLLHIVDGSVLDWDQVSGIGSIGGGVDNTFGIQFIEPQFDFLTLLDRVRLRIDGADYLFAGVKSSGDALIQRSGDFSFPDANGKVPPIYPYVIEQIAMLRADGGQIQALDANIQVTRGGYISLQVFRGGVVKTTTIVQGYGTAVESGDVEYRGPVLSNGFSVVYSSGEASATTSCTSVKKMRLTINGSMKVELGDYTMSGTQFAASSTSAIDIVTSSSVPATYPYSIGRVELISQSGTVLEDVTLVEPIKVLCGGSVVIRLMK